jgi:integrase
MNIYKPKFSDRATGAQRPTPKWYLSFRDHLRIRQRFAAFEDRDDSERLGRLVDELVRCRRLSMTPDAKWLGQLEELPSDIKSRLIGGDLIVKSWLSSFRNADVVSTYIDQFAAWLSTSRTKTGYLRNDVHVATTMQRIRDVMTGCRFRQWSDVSPAKIETFLGSLPIGASTHNGYIVAVKHFAKWCRREGLIDINPLADLGRVRTLDKETRRPLDASEVKPLLLATIARGKRFGIEGIDRAALYVVGLVTGFRRNELSWLTPESFDLDRAIVRLDGTHTKDHRDAVQPLPIGLVEPLRGFLAAKRPKGRLWHPITIKTAVMLQKDAQAAGLTIIDPEGRELVFHSLRHSLRSWLVRAKVVEAVIDDLLRHKPPRGNVGRRYYTHLTDDDRRAAIESLPVIPWPADLVQDEQVRCGRESGLLCPKL